MPSVSLSHITPWRKSSSSTLSPWLLCLPHPTAYLKYTCSTLVMCNNPSQGKPRLGSLTQSLEPRVSELESLEKGLRTQKRWCQTRQHRRLTKNTRKRTQTYHIQSREGLKQIPLNIIRTNDRWNGDNAPNAKSIGQSVSLKKDGRIAKTKKNQGEDIEKTHNGMASRYIKECYKENKTEWFNKSKEKREEEYVDCYYQTGYS